MAGLICQWETGAAAWQSRRWVTHNHREAQPPTGGTGNGGNVQSFCRPGNDPD
ncbi:hypothetical protein [Erwinia amylovora]|uniref:hypothetical protein n=1 Tax=Erwinia amylovora TaxID=552 RepID=UPI00144426A9|nr:hypothetical protein [Erwinia amylovora]